MLSKTDFIVQSQLTSSMHHRIQIVKLLLLSMQIISPDILDKRKRYSGTGSKQTAILV